MKLLAIPELVGIDAIDAAFDFLANCFNQFWAFCQNNALVMAFLIIDVVGVAVGVFFLVFGIFRRNNPS